jgi:hypothetical protein
MIKDKTQNQESGDNSANYQAETINQYGLSYRDAKEIALEVFQHNFIVLSEQAKQTARERAEELVDDFLTKIAEKNPALLNSVKEPDMQLALYSAQKSYVRTGDKEIEELLVDILIERAEQDKRGLKQLILGESLEVVPKLTIRQLDYLTLILLIRSAEHSIPRKLEDYTDYFNVSIRPFTSNFRITETTEPLDTFFEDSHLFDYLEVCRCVTVLYEHHSEKFLDIFDADIIELLLPKIDILQILRNVWDFEYWGSKIRFINCKLTALGEVLAIANYKRRTNLDINLIRSKWHYD